MTGAWISVLCDCCVVSDRGLCEELITVEGISNDCGVSFVIVGPHSGGLDPPGPSSNEKKYIFSKCT
jgi:hypothetical protein